MSVPHSAPEDSINLRELIARMRSYALEVLRSWKLVGVCILLVLAWQIYQYVTFVPTYPASITFSVDEDEGGGGGGLTGLLGQFGLGSMRPTRYNLDKIMALSRSRKVIQESLFTRFIHEGKDDFLANHLIREYQIRLPAVDSKAEQREFYFTHDSLPIFSRDENTLLLALYGSIIGTPGKPETALVKADYDEDSNIMTLTATTTNEPLSIELANRLYASLSHYYVDKSIEKQFRIYNLVNIKKDSVLAALKSTEYQLANFKDTHRGLLMRTDQVTELRLQREIAALNAMYVEVIKNREVADYGLRTKTPFIQVIDTPISPLTPSSQSLPKMLVIALIVGGLIGSAWVIARSFLRSLK